MSGLLWDCFSTKQRIKCLAQRHITVSPMRLKSAVLIQRPSDSWPAALLFLPVTLILCRPMDLSVKCDTVKTGWPFVCKGFSLYFSKYFLSYSEYQLYLANCVDTH